MSRLINRIDSGRKWEHQFLSVAGEAVRHEMVA